MSDMSLMFDGRPADHRGRIPSPNRIKLARQRREWTQGRLAQEMGVTQASVSSWESGERQPDHGSLETLSAATGFPTEWFLGPDSELIKHDAVSFRRRSRLKAAPRDRALASAFIGVRLTEWIDDQFVGPEPELPVFDAEDPEGAAEQLRTQWRLGDRPIPNMIHLVESYGVRVFSIPEESDDIDGFSFWLDGIPYMFLSTSKSPERRRFDVGHELAHLILHRDVDKCLKDEEKQADRFSSALLMPEAAVRRFVGADADVQRLRREKRRWKVSVAALNERCKALGIVSEWTHRNNCIQLRALGWHKDEPDSGIGESSHTLRFVLGSLREEGVGLTDVAQALHVPIAEVRSLVFGLAMVPMSN